MSKSKPAVSEPFPKSARVALWYAVEEAFGGVLRDELAEAYWSAEIEELDQRLRKRLRLLKLADDPHVPDAIKDFIVEIATIEQLFALAEEALAIAIQSQMERPAINKLALGLEEAFKEVGLDVRFDTSGKLVRAVGIDTMTKAITDLPDQREFKAHLGAQAQEQIAVVFRKSCGFARSLISLRRGSAGAEHVSRNAHHTAPA